ncbi:MAG: translation initiation factor IF-2 [Limnochordia bacterium]|jgi:translation initiation factor IF-2|nr:translation initiation factor IF-2 [Limnochordia bacterium]MDI9464896.1 translation initiation factor IF-2 [Bacillota bacterium]NLO95215.1 translation initiation factor IF-2 [Bacillota bacterium]HAI53040.1 translation initiation factor IF-2 [Bacillota bacterium]HAN95382.1 translation initiation factor IF-2 [Bacillota bacterium]
MPMKNKIRIYELAKELDLKSKFVVEFLNDLGADVSNHMSSIDEDIANMLREHFAPEEEETLVREETKVVKKKRRPFKEEEDRDDALKLRAKKKRGAKRGRIQEPPAQKPKRIILGESVAVNELAQKIGVPGTEVVKQLMKIGVMASLTQSVDYDTAALVAERFGVETEPERDLAEEVFAPVEQDPARLAPRPPVVTIMGHVDHGKTTLLDYIRKTKVTAQEAGGITQHIGAYQIEYNGKLITFLDTPGHEAFTAIRARGARVTDIAVLVVAANDGVMPQTVEAINHAKAAGVPIIVAINKMDLPAANPDRVKQELTEHGLVVEEWGGDTIAVPISALRGDGVEELLEMILLVAEMEDVKADPDCPARGTVIDAKLDRGRGPVATVLISQGTLRVGDSFVVGNYCGRVRALIDDRGQQIKEAKPSTPVEVLGISDVPQAGDSFVVVTDEQTARQVAEIQQEKQRERELSKTSRVTLDDLYRRIQEGAVKELNLIIKADVQGSAEAVRSSLEKLSTEEVRVNVIHQAVGAISESDVLLASASNAVIIGFNVRPEPNARKAAERDGVDIRTYRVIYNLLDDVKAAMEGLLEPEFKEEIVGRAEVRQTFKVPGGVVAGCYVLDGKITRAAQVRVLRDNVIVHEGKIASLRRFKDDVREVTHGYECGIGVERFNDIKEGDVLEAFQMVKVERSL